MIRPLTALLSATGITVFGMFAFAQNGTQYVPTYYVDVQPILEKNCVSCHVAGGIAPFALDNPTSAVQWADRIAQVTKSGYMPPFPPSKDSGPFYNERRLGSATKKILEDWAAAKAPLGKAPRK
jgi:mono/diheme cytochrome c family protein